MSRELRLNITSASNFEPHFGTRLRSDSEMADAGNKVRYWVCCTKAVRKHPSSSLHSPSKFESWQVIHSARPRTPAQYTIVRIANTGCVLNARSTQEAIIAEETFSRKGGRIEWRREEGNTDDWIGDIELSSLVLELSIQTMIVPFNVLNYSGEQNCF